MPAIIAIVTFVAILTIVAALTYYRTSTRQAFAERLDRYVEMPAGSDNGSPASSLQYGQQLTGWRAFVRQLSKHFESPKWTRLIEHKLVQAGLLLRASEFMVICAGTAALLAFLQLTLSGGRLGGAILGGAAGFIGPILYVRIRAARRVRQFNDQLGDALILIANSLRTGYSFLQSIEMVAREMPEPIAGEFGRSMKEMSLGVTTEQAMNNLAQRVGSEDLDLVVTAVLIQRQVGGNLAEVLDNIAATIRARVKLKGEIRTLTAQGRISGIILGLLPLVIGIATYLINPKYISLLFTHPIGQAMVGGAVVSQLIGVVFIRSIVNIKI